MCIKRAIAIYLIHWPNHVQKKIPLSPLRARKRMLFLPSRCSNGNQMLNSRLIQDLFILVNEKNLESRG
jgi:hypothetical protein